MAQQNPSITLDNSEVLEAISVLGKWSSRLEELPHPIREELRALASSTADFIDFQRDGASLYAVVLTPRGRALVGNLRGR
jgi:hypothetical protein